MSDLGWALACAAAMLAGCGTVPVTPDPDGGSGPGDVDGSIAPPDDGFMPPGSLEVCEEMFESQISRACTFPTDCQLLDHPDCCGDRVIAIGFANQADPAEAIYDDCRDKMCGTTGCFHPVLAEDGRTPGPDEMIVADCESNQCISIVAPLGE